MQELWGRRVENYWNLLSPKIFSDTLRNVMDMKGNLGSFAAALKYKDVWVMNVVPEDGPKTLTIEYDRGLLGTIHNWPDGFIIIRDKQLVIKFVKKYLTALHWEAVVKGDSTLDPGQDGDEVVFVIQKKLWLTSKSFRDTESKK
ncbi:probable methyltransferase PMT3 [Olea europaea subsp. europaea]|uniref:Methyltransferase n=1 Tax=Olea europaea subsp. europaea TaxID=158383 RepID=A0A8S0Q9L8_OLEEU|nr:probable methyltransferase PMT3 [Olea europaea subsp. europaea]